MKTNDISGCSQRGRSRRETEGDLSSSSSSSPTLVMIVAGEAALTAMVLEVLYNCGILDEAVGAENVAFGKTEVSDEVTGSTLSGTVPLPNSARIMSMRDFRTSRHFDQVWSRLVDLMQLEHFLKT